MCGGRISWDTGVGKEDGWGTSVSEKRARKKSCEVSLRLDGMLIFLGRRHII